jgi:UDP-N-acetylglucosamine 2-epimerase
MKIPDNLDLVTIAGNRPELIKLSELVKSFPQYKHAFLYTGQHYSNNMKEIFSDEFDVQPDYDLACNSSDLNFMQDRITDFLRKTKPKYVLVYGDTNSTMAAALATKVVGCKLIHIEAGLRSFDTRMPEERNRMKIDALSDCLCAPTDLCSLFLKYENIQNNVFVTGNLIVDVCRKYSLVLSDQKYTNHHEILSRDFILLTLHRAENADDESILRTLAEQLSHVNYKVVFPIHPRTRKSITRYNIVLPDNVLTIDPLGYSEFLHLLKKCILVLTDSGGVQEEAAVLKRPCITLRETTERWETLLIKANILFPLARGLKQPSLLNRLIEDMINTKITTNPYGENVTRKIVEIVNKFVLENEVNNLTANNGVQYPITNK